MTIFVDASFLFALFNKDDEFHQRSKDIFKGLEESNPQLVTSNIVIAETVNLAFREKGAKAGKRFFKAYKKSGIEEVFVDKGLFTKAYLLLFSQDSRRGLNFFDCLHLAVMKHLRIKTILSFDKYFTREVEVIGIGV